MGREGGQTESNKFKLARYNFHHYVGQASSLSFLILLSRARKGQTEGRGGEGMKRLSEQVGFCS